MLLEWGMIRLGASVEENAKATYEDLLGSPDPNEPGYKPMRADIQKLYDLWSLHNSIMPGTDRSSISPQAEAAREWYDNHEPTDRERKIVRLFQYFYDNRNGPTYRDQQKCFDLTARALTTGDDVPAGVARPFDLADPIDPDDDIASVYQARKKELGIALKKYEDSRAPLLYSSITSALDSCWNESKESYKMWPWMVKQIKEDFKERMYDGSLPPDSRNLLPGVQHLVDIVKEAGPVLAKLKAENKLPANMDFQKMTFRDFEDWFMEWKKENLGSEFAGQVVYEFHNGWTIQKLTTPEQLQYEGDEMGHCVGGYSHKVAGGSDIIYSLRDNKGEPHVTMEVVAKFGNEIGPGVENQYVHPDSHEPEEYGQDKTFDIIQIQGQGNKTPKPEYQHMIKEFLDSLREKGWKFRRSESWYGNWDEDNDEEEYSEYIRDAQELNDWWEDHYQPNYQRYRQAEEKQDAYGLPLNSTRIRPGVDWSDVIKSVMGSLVDEYDPGRYRGNWAESAQQVYHAWVADMYADNPTPEQLAKEKESLESEITSAEEELWEWESNNEYYAMQDDNLKAEVVEKCVEHMQKDGSWPEFLEQLKRLHMDEVEEEGDEWEPEPDDIYELLEEEHDDLLADVRHEEVNRYYSEDARKFLKYLYLLVNKNGMVGPNDLPDPNQRNGGLPSYEDLEKLPWKSEGDQEAIDIPGTLSSVHWGIVDIGKCATCGGSVGADGYCMQCGRFNDEYWRPQRVPRFQQGMPGQPVQGYPAQAQGDWSEVERIPGTFSSFNSDEIEIYPIDQEHNIWLDEEGNEVRRWRPGWVKDPETGKMVQSGELEDTFLDKQGRQGQGYAAYHNGKPVASLTYVDDPAGWYMLGTAYTHPDYRQQGLFNRLAQPLRDTGKPIDAYVWNNPWLKNKVRGWRMSKVAAGQIMYHVAPVSARDSIQKYGLDWNRSGSPNYAEESGDTPGNWLYDREPWPEVHYLPEHEDVWAVDVSDLQPNQMWTYEQDEPGAFMLDRPVPPERLTLHRPAGEQHA